MVITGSFLDINGETIEVAIFNGSTDEVLEIEDSSRDILFTDNPIEIETENENLFQTLIKKSCSVNLLTKTDLYDKLFSNNSRDIQVTVKKSGKCLFGGYVEPQTLSQPYSELYDELNILATDYISTLQYYTYLDAERNYNVAKLGAKNRSFKEIILRILSGADTAHIYFDNSVVDSRGSTKNIFDVCGVNDLVFFGDSEGDVWDNESVLREILQYLNLHIIQIGEDFYIFNYDTFIGGSGEVEFTDLRGNGSVVRGNNGFVQVQSTEYTGNSTNVSIDDVYNQIRVKCEIDGVETLIESPLDSDGMKSLYKNKELYCREYSVIKQGDWDFIVQALWNMLCGTTSNWDYATVTETYFQAKYSPNWKFLLSGIDLSTDDRYNTKVGNEYTFQTELAHTLFKETEGKCVAGLFSFGSVTTQTGGTNSSTDTANTVDMKDYIYISTRGNGNFLENGEWVLRPDKYSLQVNTPLVSYHGGNITSLSPTDDTTTNYIIFSGKILIQSYDAPWITAKYEDLQKIVEKYDKQLLAPTEFYNATIQASGGNPLEGYNMGTVSCEGGEGYRLVTRDFVGGNGKIGISLAPPSEAYKKRFQLTLSSSIMGDIYPKYSVLECQLKIGDKYLCEVIEYGKSYFYWRSDGDFPLENGVPKNTFSIGFDPQNGDYIIGETHEIANNISISMNLGDSRGMAIPIKKEDNLSGEVEFNILGAVNYMVYYLNEYPFLIRKSDWWDMDEDLVRENPIYYNSVLQHTSAILLEDFKVQIKSDNSNIDDSGFDNDLVYLSAEDTKFINKKEEINFKIHTALTANESYELGVRSGVNQNTVIKVEEKEALQSIYDKTKNETAKAEEHFIDSNYKLYMRPKVLLETELRQQAFSDVFSTYKLNYLPQKRFIIQSQNYNAKYDVATIKFREI